MSEKKRYSVGQVVFVIVQQQDKIMPLQIVEEITKKTVSGEEIIYKAVYGGDAERKQYNLSLIKGEIFSTIEDVKKFLMTNTANWIEKIVTDAQKKTEAWYGVQETSQVYHEIPQESTQEQDPNDFHEGIVEMPDGSLVKARVTKAFE